MTGLSSCPLPLDDARRDQWAEVFANLCVKAGAPIMEVYARGCKEVRIKADRSPVSEADELAEALITKELAQCAPGVPVVAEEACARGDKPSVDERFILVDPLDGTREFLSRNGEFTVNIALVEKGIPVVGAVYAPALAQLWFAGNSAISCRIEPGAELSTATRIQALRTRPCPSSHWIALASRSHCDAETETFLSEVPVGERRSAGSSIKFCVLADGEADLYPRFGPTMEWDTAAGDAVLRAAGGIVLRPDGSAFRYGKPGFRNEAFIAWADPDAAQRYAPSQAGLRPTGPDILRG